MPIYEYECKSCHDVFELFQKMTDKAHADCPKCGKPAKRIISQTSFTLKGGGWYKDGYATGGSATKSSSSAKSSDSSKPKTESKKKESKPSK